MRSCIGCRYAEWDKDKAGRLHRSGDGKCTYKVYLPILPNSRYWPGFSNPSPSGGYIERKHVYKTDCPCYQPEGSK